MLPIKTDILATIHEILVGPTSRSGDAPANLNDYEIRLRVNYLIINGGSSYTTNYGVQALIGVLKTQITFANGYLLTGSNNNNNYSLINGYHLAWNDEFN